MVPRNGVVLADHSDHLHFNGLKKTDRISLIGDPAVVEDIVKNNGLIDYSKFSGNIVFAPHDVVNAAHISYMRETMEVWAKELVEHHACVLIACWAVDEIKPGYSIMLCGANYNRYAFTPDDDFVEGTKDKEVYFALEAPYTFDMNQNNLAFIFDGKTWTHYNKNPEANPEQKAEFYEKLNAIQENKPSLKNKA